MCGIIGYAGRAAPTLVERMISARDEMIHRGPDDAGQFVDSFVCLGSRRLSVLDLSPAGHMPMVSADGQFVIVFNGEIYNFVELRAELERHVAFRSTGDTEVLLNAFRVWGWPAMLDRLDGMFAFAVWDASNRQLYAARDRLGEKPFFHARTGEGFAFASTLHALTRLRGGRHAVNVRALDAYLTYQAVPSPLSIFEGCSQLPPGHCLRFDARSGDLQIDRYWNLSFAPKIRVSEREAVDTIDGMLRRSITKRLRSDVPNGTLLSGGVDSSIVTAIASQENGAPIDAVTMGYEGAEEDERPYARAVAARYGVRLHEEVLAPSVVRDLPSIVWQYGQPVADVSIVPNYYLAAAARRYMTVALVGDGADETFGGYARPMIERVAPLYRRLLPRVVRQRIASHAGVKPGLRTTNQRMRELSLIVDAGAGSARDAFVYTRGFRGIREASYTPALLDALRGTHPDTLYAEAWDRAIGMDDVDRALYGDLTTYLPDQLLAKADVSSMAFGLETRSPFLAREIVEYAAALPTSVRLRHFTTKYLLKRVAERYMPREAIYRRKRGFVIPASQWLRGELAPYVRAALDTPRFFERGWMQPDVVRRLIAEHQSGDRDWGNQIWTLLVLEIWAGLTLDQSLSRSDPLEALFDDRSRAPLRRAPVVRPGRTPGAPAALHTLQIGMEWFAESPGGLNRVYARLLPELTMLGVGVEGLVAGTEDVATDSGGLVTAFARRDASLAVRMRAVRTAVKPWFASNKERSVLVSHFALYAAPVLDYAGRVPFVVHFQGPWGQESLLEGGSTRSAAAKEGLERMVYRRADAAIVLSSAFAGVLSRRFGVHRDKIHVVPGGVESARFRIPLTRRECRERLGWPTDRRIVLCVRRLVRRVGVDTLVEAAAELRHSVPDALVLIAGAGPLREELLARIEALDLRDHVRLLGFVPDTDLPCAYRAADLSVVPTAALEGFGLITVESLAAGTPCVVTPVDGLSEVVGPFAPQLIAASTGAADIGRALAEALTGVRDVPSAEECADYARQNHDWSVIARRVRDVYESVLP